MKNYTVTVEQMDLPAAMTDRQLLAEQGGLRLERAVWQGQPVFVKTLWSPSAEVKVLFEHETCVLRALGPALAAAPLPAGVACQIHVPLIAADEAHLVFPFLDGGTLRDRLELGPLAAGEAVAVTLGLLDALCALHAVGLVHHDVKPENVLLVDSQTTRSAVRLIDFGMSHLPACGPDRLGNLRMGTPHFMAPEQFAGQRGDPRSDLYGVGAVLYDCLKGVPPFQDALAWLCGHTDEPPAWPGPDALTPLLRAALARDPADRPQSAEQMRAQLAALALQGIGGPT